MLPSLRLMPLLVSMAFLFFNSVAFAATITVTTTEDEFYNENGQCSLREAILAANDNINVDGDCTAGESDVVDTIVVPAGTYILDRSCNYDKLESSLLLPGGVECGDLDIEESVTIQGAGIDVTIIQAAPEYLVEESVSASDYEYFEDFRIFDIDDYQDELVVNEDIVCDDSCSVGLEVSFTGMTLTGGTSYTGGAIRLNQAAYDTCFYNSLVVDSVKATANEARYEGGAIAAYGQVTVVDSEIEGNYVGISDMYNYSEGRGAGIAIFGPESYCAGEFDSSISNTSVTNNTAINGYGGGIYNVYMSNLSVSDSVVDMNMATYAGAGIYNEFSDLDVTGGSISGNKGYDTNSYCTLGGVIICDFEDDEYVPGTYTGGGIYNSIAAFYEIRGREIKGQFLASDVTVTGTEILNNLAMYAGGGIMNATPDFFCQASVAGEISADICVGSNADLEPQPDEPMVIPNSSFTLTGATVSGNVVQSPYESSGAGVYNSYYTGEFSIVETTISENTGGYAGGGVFNDWAMTISKSTINNNSTSEPLLRRLDPRVAAEEVSEVYVTSFGGGGGVANSGSLVMTNSTVSANETYGIGAGVGNNLSERYYYYYEMSNQTADPEASPTSSPVSDDDDDDDDDDYDDYVLEPLPLPGTDLRNVTVTANTVLPLSQEDIDVTSDFYGEVYASNGGGIATRYGAIRLRNSLVAGNSDEAENFSDFMSYIVADPIATPTPEADPVDLVPAFAPDCWVEPKESYCMMEDDSSCEDFLPQIVSEQHNLIGDNTGCVPFESVSNENQDKIGTGESPIDPLLGALADNGGPTATHALLADSPAIDMGNSTGEIAAAAVDASFACEADDQRSLLRPVDGDLDGTATCDIGAYEVTFDCAGVDGGSAVEDECGVCGGDGSSCATPDEVQCDEVDITETQFALDGSADEQLKLAKRLRRKLKRKTGKRNAGRNLVALVNELRNQNWNFAWSLPPVVRLNCTGAVASCVEVSNQDALSAYISNANEMFDAIKKLIRKLRKEGLGKKQRRKFVKRNATILDSALLSTEAVPAATTVCE